ncbi:MAG: LiaF-related protein [Agathobacter sp.]|nr:LiaF-related protein [Agathobacter sp.]
MKNQKNVAWGILLILLSVYIVVNKLGIFPKIPVVSILLSLVFIYFIVKGIKKRNYFEIFFPAALIGCLFDDEISHIIGYNFNDLTPWSLLLVALLLSIGFEILFKKDSFIKIGDGMHGTFSEESSSDGFVKIETAFDNSTRYINSACFESALISNSFGKNVVYFNNAIIKDNNAFISVENSFGQTIIYIPKEWRVDVTRECCFGNIKVVGNCTTDVTAPFVKIKAEVAFGDIEIIYV